MKITKKNIVNYLITLQLVNAGYQITYDEIEEMNFLKQYLNPRWRWFEDYVQSYEQQQEWYKQCNPIVRKIFYCNKIKAEKILQLFNFDCGIITKI